MHQEFDPPEQLRDTIKCFWYDRQEFGPEFTQFRVMPDGYAEIIFHFGGDCSIRHDDGLQALPSPFMMGLLNQPAYFYARNCFEIIAVRFYPWTVFDLLGLPSGKGGLRMFEHPIAQLQPQLNQLMQSGKTNEALKLVENYLLDARQHLPAGSMLYKAGIAMREANGSIPVSQVAEAAHATVRTLERNFKQSSGHTVKDVSALIRFEQVRNKLWHEPDVNLAGLAHELGYTDQSHLSREFKRYSGTTPGVFARRAREGKQAFGDDFVAFIQS